MLNPLISVIIPVYNTEIFLDRCLTSVENQTFKNIEIIVVDDGSPGNCKEICSKYPLVKYTSYNENRGLFAAREYGVRQACGQYIFHVDSDDWLPLDACSHIAKAISKTNADIYMHASKRFLPKNTLRRSALKVHGNLLEYFTKKDTSPHVFIWQLSIKRDILLKIYDDLQVKEHFILSEDVLHFYACLYYANNWDTISEICYHYNESNQSATRKILTTEKVLIDLNYMSILFSYLEKFRQTKGLPKNIFENIKRRQLMDRLSEIKTEYANIDWDKVFPILFDIFGTQYISDSLFDVIYNPSMKYPIRILVSKIHNIQQLILPKESWLFNILQGLWWKIK
ncbi:MAG: glycosyltransferase family 2 protein [Brevinema sp.]